MNTNTTGQQAPMGDPTPQGGQGMSGAGDAAPKTAPGTSPGTVKDPNKISDPNITAPSKVEDPSPPEMPDIAKPDTKPNVGKGGNVQTPKEPVE